jgi:hypothetical protein
VLKEVLDLKVVSEFKGPKVLKVVKESQDLQGLLERQVHKEVLVQQVLKVPQVV